MPNPDDISVCSFNCRSFKNSLHEIHSLCVTHDVVLLQEHWLLPFDLPLLNTAHNDFISVGLSAVDTSVDILIGRPYGGTAILYRKNLASKITIVDSHESRITGIQVMTNIGPFLLLNVYMPTNYGDDLSLESYIDCLSQLHVLIVESDAIHTLIAGDFNCSPGSRFFNDFNSFASDNNLITTDLNRLHNIATYISDDGSKMSWVDHILSSITIDSLINNIHVLNDVIISDHKPLSFDIKGANINNVKPADAVNNDIVRVPLWNNCDATAIADYTSYLDKLLQHVDIPYDALFHASDGKSFLTDIDKFYNDICDCLVKATADIIPSRERAVTEFNIPGWNTYVAEKHEAAREAFLVWMDFGKPRFGHYFDNMKKTRGLFKLALRYCRNHIEELKADACADNLHDKDCRKFWSSVYKISNNKASSHVDSVGDATGPQNVTSMWKDHFEKLYNSSAGTKYRTIFEEKLEALSFDNLTPLLTVMDIKAAMTKQKRGKSPGPDGIHMDAFIHGGPRLNLLLSILFNLFLLYGYVPDAFHRATIIPLVKCKTGDLSDVNNYRAIALSNSVTKIIESLLYSFVESRDRADEYQFGFKKNHSTALCTHVFKKTVNYYRQNGSHVFACFIDFNKAFDNVDYWLLFSKLIDTDTSVSCYVATRLLAYWYSNQQMFVRWQNISSAFFNITNGVRQGGILSPFLFRFYIRDLIDRVTTLNLGCNFAGTVINLLAYADDMVVLAPCWQALQSLLMAVEDAASKINMSFNTKKTVCMVFNPYNRRKIICAAFPQFTLAGCKLQFVEHFRYLGHIIDNCLCDDKDIQREIKALFTRSNILCRRFKCCSVQVKLKLFRSFCICLYDAALWSNFTVTAVNKLSSCYTKCIKSFFNYAKYSSVTAMLLELGLPSFNTLMHNCQFSFKRSLLTCNNFLVISMLNCC